MSSKIPRGETKKTVHELKPTTANAGQKSDNVLKPPKENVPRKNVAPKVHKGYGQQAELKKQNQHLMTANEDLQKNLSDTQQRVAELELQYNNLEKENAEVHKNLKDCHVIMVASKIDPVLGETVGDAARQNEDQRKEVLCVSTDLLNELKTFGEVASQQHVQLHEIQAKMAHFTKARVLMLQERENFSLEAAELENALKEAKALLLL